MWPNLLLVTYAAIVGLSSLAGGWLPTLVHLTHTRMQFMTSFVAGLMLGVAVLHLLPHGIAELGATDPAVRWLLAGLLTMFFMQRVLHFHQHGTTEFQPPEGSEGEHAHSHGHAHGHHHHHHEPAPLTPAFAEQETPDRRGAFRWLGVAIGLSVHTLLDGVALAASVHAEAEHGTGWTLFGLGTFLAVVLHKPLDAASITALMSTDAWSAPLRHAMNALFAVMCPLGVLLSSWWLRQAGEQQHVWVGSALAFSAGMFLCISLADLLPEVEFHTHDRGKLSALLLAGIAVAFAVGFLEPDHAHQHQHGNDAHETHAGHVHE